MIRTKMMTISDLLATPCAFWPTCWGHVSLKQCEDDVVQYPRRASAGVAHIVPHDVQLIALHSDCSTCDACTVVDVGCDEGVGCETGNCAGCDGVGAV